MRPDMVACGLGGQQITKRADSERRRRRRPTVQNGERRGRRRQRSGRTGRGPCTRRNRYAATDETATSRHTGGRRPRPRRRRRPASATVGVARADVARTRAACYFYYIRVGWTTVLRVLRRRRRRRTASSASLPRRRRAEGVATRQSCTGKTP